MSTRRNFLKFLGFAPAAPFVPKAVLDALGPECYVEIDGVPIRGTKPPEIPDGVAGAPAFSFTNDTDTGFYRSGSEEIGFSVGGTRTAYIAKKL